MILTWVFQQPCWRQKTQTWPHWGLTEVSNSWGEKMVFYSTKFCSTLLHHCIRHLSHCGNKSWQKSLKEGRIYLAHSSKERSLPWGEDMVAEEEWSHCVYCQETEKNGGWCSTHFLLCIQLGSPACGMVPPTCGRHHLKYPNLVAPLQTYPQVCLHVS